jgi:hypothetical protein
MFTSFFSVPLVRSCEAAHNRHGQTISWISPSFIGTFDREHSFLAVCPQQCVVSETLVQISFWKPCQHCSFSLQLSTASGTLAPQRQRSLVQQHQLVRMIMNSVHRWSLRRSGRCQQQYTQSEHSNAWVIEQRKVARLQATTLVSPVSSYYLPLLLRCHAGFHMRTFYTLIKCAWLGLSPVLMQ